MPLVDVTASGISSSSAEQPDGDVRPLDDVRADGLKSQALVQPRVGREVQQRVEEREQAQHAPQRAAGRSMPVSLPQRRHQQRDQQQVQRRLAAGVDDPRAPDRRPGPWGPCRMPPAATSTAGTSAGREHQRLDDVAFQVCAVVQKLRRRSMPAYSDATCSA